MNILITGQCTLHWGRMEFGNIGNFYIMEALIRELHRTFANASIKTTFQMSQIFCDKENIEVLPMSLFYSWKADELDLARRELEISEALKEGKLITNKTPFINAVMWADLVIDFSGDIWGDNADFLGENRFEIGLIKDKVAQNLGKLVVMLAGSPGPFGNDRVKRMALDVYQGFDLVTNREPISTTLLKKDGFDTSKTLSLACPAFLFEPANNNEIQNKLNSDGLTKTEKPIVGFIICGWNFETGPFDKWPRDDQDYIHFAEAVEFLTEELGVRVCLMSHSNGFEVPVVDFKLIHGRDYPIIKQLEKVLIDRGISQDFLTLNDIYDAWQTKAVISNFDMLVSGRVHAAVAALSQTVPTVIIDYGHEPKAHKLLGFATVAGVEDFVVDPSNSGELIQTIEKCWQSQDQIRAQLRNDIPIVKELARENFKRLKALF